MSSLPPVVQQWLQTVDYSNMQQTHELKALAKALGEIARAVRFLERRAEAADLPVNGYLRHASGAETAEERYYLKPGS